LFGATKERLSSRLGLKGKPLDKFKFAIVPRSGYGKAEYLTDGKFLINYIIHLLIPAIEDILSEALGPDDYLGVDHANKNKPAANRGDQIYIK
jgi:ubiquitin carboxyl-terminal hydrolase 7